MEEINKHIDNTFDHETAERLKEENLIDIYKKQKSVQTEISNLTSILSKNGVDILTIKRIIDDYTLALVPPGTKGVVKGNLFNDIVKERILSIKELKTPEYDISFEKFHPDFMTDERPDWYIYRKTDRKIVLGMNQLDLWGGGQQLNRGSKYVLDESRHLNSSVKHLSVLCNYIQLKSVNNKAFRILERGFATNRVCFLKELPVILLKFFT